MIGLLVLSHGNLCTGLLHTAKTIAGFDEKMEAIALQAEDNIEEYAVKMEKAIKELDDGDGVLVMVDLLGGTPFNKSTVLYKQYNIEVVTGVSIPMLFAAIEGRMMGKSLKELSGYCTESAREGIKSLSELV